MTTMSFVDPEVSSVLFVSFLIFFARVLDVSIGTLRITFVSRGLKLLAASLGFFEALVWILAIAQAMQHLDHWSSYFAYALGFGTGNFLGLLLEERLAVGNLVIRLITLEEAPGLANALWRAGYGVTSVDAQGESGPVKIIFTVLKRHSLEDVISLIRKFEPNAFYTIEDVRFFKTTLRPLPLHGKVDVCRCSEA